MGVINGMQIRAADAARNRLNQNLAGPGTQIGKIIDNHGTVSKNRSSHGVDSPT